MTEDEHDK